MPPHVLLLKNLDDASRPDAYQSAFTSHNISSSIIPTLSHSYTNPDELADVIAHGRDGSKEYGGVIVTSGRAVDAWVNVLKVLDGREGRVGLGVDGWADTPFYVVGPRTEKQLLDARNSGPRHWNARLPTPELVLGAKEAGTGEALAKFICLDYPSRNKDGMPLLYLVGDKNAGGAEGVLRDAGIGVKLVQVYATEPSGTFEEDFGRAVGGIAEGLEVCIVFFAPSSAELALPTIRKHFTLRSSLSPPSQTSNTLDKPIAKVVAIGPTTARALSTKHSVPVDATSAKPEPGALVDAILSLSLPSG
ncbi:tetrapyrrole biosynthesis, uroporphyrinogen III synthase [Ceratobasidium sp. AG-I]|nr:tetrapyrrole biosynthesis, uroporphyrinogen III synthase [Ceratobasidium sp. AG-I]